MLKKIKEKIVEYFYATWFVFRILIGVLFLLSMILICSGIGDHFLGCVGNFIGMLIGIVIFMPITLMMLPK